MRATVERLNQLLIRTGEGLQPLFLLFVRVYWGWQLHVAGRGKMHDPDKVVSYFTELHIPLSAFSAYFVSGLEFVGGFLLIVGLASRPVALLIVIDMVVAYFAADRTALMSIFSDPDRFAGAAPFTILLSSLIIFIFGAGAFSVDAVLARRGKKRA